MNELSDYSEDEKDQERRVGFASEPESIESDSLKDDSSMDKYKNDLSPLEDTSVKMSSSEAATDVDPHEKRKKYNIEEAKYPLEYK